jgi:hypothetical protein
MLLRQRKNRRRSTSKTTCRFDDEDHSIAPLKQGVYGRALLRGLWEIVLHERCPIQNDLFPGMPIRAPEGASEASPADGAGDDKAGGVEKTSDLSVLWDTVHAQEGFPEALSKLYRKAGNEDFAGREAKEAQRCSRGRNAPVLHELVAGGGPAFAGTFLSAGPARWNHHRRNSVQGGDCKFPFKGREGQCHSAPGGGILLHH